MYTLCIYIVYTPLSAKKTLELNKENFHIIEKLKTLNKVFLILQILSVKKSLHSKF